MLQEREALAKEGAAKPFPKTKIRCPSSSRTKPLMRSTLLRNACLAWPVALLPGVALAQDASTNGPHGWQVWLQPAVTPVGNQVHSFMGLLQWVITAITLFVLVLLAYTCWRFQERRQPVPSRRSHNTILEVLWTAVPVLILVIIAIPSFKLLYAMDVVPETEMTLKAIGRQWYWTYEYPDQENLTFDAYMVADGDLQAGQRRLLTTDNAVVLPTDTNIRLQTTASDVIHSWAMQPFGIKVDAVPGHLNELWFNIQEPGIYYGQCSELCGVNHAFMPIMIQAMSREQFDAWVQEAKQKFARVGETVPALAAASPAATN
jgi:cytochrome c oxidase subunit 2